MQLEKREGNRRILIIYFSQTGNTRKIAECIQEGIIDVTHQCDVKPLSDVDVESLSTYDLVGLGSPVFYYKEPFNVSNFNKEPFNVSNFIEALPQLNGQHWSIFCTHGNVIGNFFPSLTKKLRGKDATVVGFHNCYANITVPFYPKPSYTSGHPDSYDFEQAKLFSRKMAKDRFKPENQRNVPIAVPNPVSSEDWIQDSNRLTRETLGEVLPKLSINKDTCVQCHKCEENCPVDGIIVEAAPPHIQDPCIYCWRCVNVCPTLSIGADWEMLVRMAPANYARYKKELDKAAERGEFRWMVEPETIIFNDPLYKQHEREARSKE